MRRATAGEPAPGSPAGGGPSPYETDGTPVDANYRRVELLAIAARVRLPGRHAMTKPALVQALNARLAASPPGPVVVAWQYLDADGTDITGRPEPLRHAWTVRALDTRDGSCVVVLRPAPGRRSRRWRMVWCSWGQPSSWAMVKTWELPVDALGFLGRWARRPVHVATRADRPVNALRR